MIKIISCDLDGTLLNNHKIISDDSINKLIDYQKQGKILVLASGRYYREIEKFTKQLHMKEFGGYVVCGNGYEVIDLKKDEHHFFEKIAPDVVHTCLRLADKHHLLQYVNINGRYYLSTNKAEKIFVNGVKKGLHALTKANVKQISYASHLLDESILEKDLTPFINEGIIKICVIGSPSNQKKWIKEINELFPQLFAFYPVNSCSLEITHHSVSKKNAVHYIAKKNGYSLENVIAFGDSGNDEPLLNSAGIGITMKNGTKRALSKAKIISSKTNHEDGVIFECEKYLKD